MSFFGGNPFNTPVGQRIEHATDASLASENWALNMEICDIINETEEGPKDGIKAIRKRLAQNAGKNYTVVMYTLTVLETCVKNCGRRFHLLASNKEFVQELVKLIGPKNDPPTAVQEKVLSLIQSWADAFKANPEMVGVVQVYQDLKQKGVEFPMTDMDAMAPIHTPHRTVPEMEPILPPRSQPPPSAHPTQAIVGGTMLPLSGHAVAPPVVSGSVTMASDQLAKLRSELDVVQGNMRIFSEMLTELQPGHEHPSDLDLLQELCKTCKAMQMRIVDLIDKVANEEVTSELLLINDELNNTFLRYSRFEKNRPLSQQATPPQDSRSKFEEEPLIDLGDAPVVDNDIHVRLAGMSLASGIAGTTLSQVNSVPAQHGGNVAVAAADDEFDMFAQSRGASYERSKQSGSTYQDNSQPEQVGATLGSISQTRHVPDNEEYFDEQLQTENDFDEMEAWLKGKPATGAGDSQHDAISSTEFDRFLADRVAVGEQLPTTIPPRPNSSRRHMEKEETENRLFAL